MAASDRTLIDPRTDEEREVYAQAARELLDARDEQPRRAWPRPERPAEDSYPRWSTLS